MPVTRRKTLALLGSSLAAPYLLPGIEASAAVDTAANSHGFQRPAYVKREAIEEAIAAELNDVLVCVAFTVPTDSPYTMYPRSLWVESNYGFSIISASTDAWQLADRTLIPDGILPNSTFGGEPADYGGVMANPSDHQGGNDGVPGTGTVRVSTGIFNVNNAPQGFMRFSTLKGGVTDLPKEWLPDHSANRVMCVRSWPYLRAETDRSSWYMAVNCVWDEYPT